MALRVVVPLPSQREPLSNSRDSGLPWQGMEKVLSKLLPEFLVLFFHFLFQALDLIGLVFHGQDLGSYWGMDSVFICPEISCHSTHSHVPHSIVALLKSGNTLVA